MYLIKASCDCTVDRAFMSSLIVMCSNDERVLAMGDELTQQSDQLKQASLKPLLLPDFTLHCLSWGPPDSHIQSWSTIRLGQTSQEQPFPQAPDFVTVHDLCMMRSQLL